MRIVVGRATRKGSGYVGSKQRGKYEHVAVCELALGKTLPPGAEVHHVNGVKTDNRADNLVICPSRSYHALLHMRQRAIDACGNPNHRRCEICGEWGSVDSMYIRKSRSGHWHRSCGNRTRLQRKRNHRSKAQ